MKNIADPIHIFRWRPGGPASTSAPTELRKENTIIVADFDSLSDGADTRFFAAGLVEDITTALATVAHLSVVSVGASSRYVLGGSVRSTGEMLRISARLTEQAKDSNRTKSSVRVRVEHIFGAQANDVGGTLVRTIGLVRAKGKIAMKNLAYNMRRLGQLGRLSPCPA